MILRRLAQAFAEQNWFTVVLELAIVVVGIFLGLQVTEWNEARKFRAQEATYVELLRDDAATMRAVMEERRSQREALADRMRSALVALETCDDSPDARTAVKAAFENYQSGPGIGIIDATYNEMVSSGSLARMRDRSLKTAIANAFSELQVLNSRLESFRVSMPVVDAIVWQRVPYGIDASGRVSADIDLPAICDDIPIRNAVMEMWDIQLDGVTTFRRGLDQIDALLSELDEKFPAPSSR